MPVSVMKMKIVPTVTVRLVVLVSKDSLEMARYVKVGFQKHPSRTPQANHDCVIYSYFESVRREY